MKEKIAMLEPYISRLTKRAAEEGLAVSVVVRPVLCPLDERTAMFDSLMGAALGSMAATAMAPQALADHDSPVDDLVARVEKLEARKCRCADRPDGNCASPDPKTWIGTAQPVTC